MNLDLLPLRGNESLYLPEALSHAYILAGGQGSGRGLLLRYLCQMALCQHQPPCGTCRSCGKVIGGYHPDILHRGQEKVLNVEEVREIRRDVYISPNEGKRKIYVIHQADLLNHQGQNALLKTLEEPPSYALFFLITQEGGAVLETIRSRCQQLNLHPLSYGQTLAYLEETFPQAENLPQIAQDSQGYIGRALAILRPPPPSENSGLKPVKKGRKPATKAPAPQVQEVGNRYLDSLAEAVERALFAQQELALLEACRAIESLDKEQTKTMLDLLRARLSRALRANPDPRILTWIHRLEEITFAVSSYVKNEQIACWMTASLSSKGKGGL